MSKHRKQPLDTFESPEQLPHDSQEARRWQAANRSFWESRPMRYDWRAPIGQGQFSRAFYEEVDHRLFSATRSSMPWRTIPFDDLIDYEELRGKRVLEVGVGMGSHGQLLAAHAASYVGVDITRYAAEATSGRFRAYGLPGSVCQMDAERMAFSNGSFDYIWSWGVVHHSSNTASVIKEMHRVLRPRGEALVMVYHRGWWNYYLLGSLLLALAPKELLGRAPLAKAVQMRTDGALARYYTKRSWRRMVGEYFGIADITVRGLKAGLFPMPGGRLKDFLMWLAPDKATRFMSSRLAMGEFLISRLVRR